MSGSLAQALLGSGFGPPQAPAGPAPLSSMPGQFGVVPNAVSLQRANPTMPWYQVPGIFAGPPPAPAAPAADPNAAAAAAAAQAQQAQQPYMLPNGLQSNVTGGYIAPDSPGGP